MNNELETKPDETQSWGYYRKLESGDESDEIGLDWFEAGKLGKYDLNDEESLNSLHALVNSYTNLLRESQERPFMMIIEPAMLRVNPDSADANTLYVKLEPEEDESTIEELREYRDKLRVK